jgi:hypothetical protein
MALIPGATLGAGSIAPSQTKGIEDSLFCRILPFARTLAIFCEPREFYGIEANVANG